MKVLITESLESLLQSKWTEFLDSRQVMRLCLEHVRDTEYQRLHQKQLHSKQLKLSVTKFVVTDNCAFEFWLEFQAPKDNGVVLGTHICSLALNGDIQVKESYGTHFVFETA